MQDNALAHIRRALPWRVCAEPHIGEIVKIQLNHGFSLLHADAVDNATARAAAGVVNDALGWLQPVQRRALAGLGIKLLSVLVDAGGRPVAGTYTRSGATREILLRASDVGSCGFGGTVCHELAHALLDGGDEVSAWRVAAAFTNGAGIMHQICQQRLAEEEARLAALAKLGVRP